MNEKIAILHDRSAMLTRARAFFGARAVREIDCPILTTYASIDAHIDLIPAKTPWGIRYMHSSPEYGMKRLLSEGIGDIYQISHVFRDGEFSVKHNPEFTMAEWYRLGISFDALIAETVDFTRLFLGDLPSHTISYREAFIKYAGIDYVNANEKDLAKYLNQMGIETYQDIERDGKDAYLNLILGTIIEPNLGKDGLCALAYYPASQAALAQTHYKGEEAVCERFELYYKGVELSNGYHELSDALEQRRRFRESNAMRLSNHKQSLPMDEYFLQALEKGIPDCCGVAVGFDRLMMLRHHKSNLSDIMPFGWQEA